MNANSGESRSASGRVGERSRRTLETRIEARLDLDRRGRSHVDTGLAFLDHMIGATVFHGGMTLDLRAQGDLDIDDHHTVEDCGLVFGSVIRDALGDGGGIRRFGYAYAPLDEALARAVVDLSGRPFASVDLGLRREMLGTVATENLPHFFASLATSGGLTLHLDVIRGDNDHHRAEAAFKAFGLALAEAVAERAVPGVPSTKGVLESAGLPQ
ncbi:MAG: imidazoleglycerol-phosphate dehydratase HisB [Gemmatimonadota bacterium]|uniref:imidazoleglycerol-phosphate dehydratase HisB n=1 Tax=Candidatus Palauibacter scopulicola TaxID=3056741 RepID=UPI00238938D8|nr:imidazoleglycerol-phosphate dehydratase HisB [Candidatus Palauibacter scopulicola]MDE2662664.1 imidazoleglycerol-phosphate dehydratase HisB [Candidatus Palauibacter scopulicola]